MTIAYKVEVLRSGQPRPYADHENEYLITVRMKPDYGKDKGEYRPWLMYGDVEAQIKHDEAARAAKTMFGGTPPDELRKQQRAWALQIVRALCHNFRETTDEDGRKDMEAYFYPTLKWLRIDPTAGTIRAFIVTPYTG